MTDISVSLKCADFTFHLFHIRHQHLQKIDDIKTVVQLMDNFRRIFRMRANESIYKTLCHFYENLGYTAFNYFIIPEMTIDDKIYKFDINAKLLFNETSFPIDQTDLDFGSGLTFTLLR
jgi:hypothetical protein